MDGAHRGDDNHRRRVHHQVVHPSVVTGQAEKRGILQDHPITLPP
jgi:hypothetical protein